MGKFYFGLGLPAAERGKELLEMQLLPAICDVDDFVRMPILQAVGYGSQISRRVIESAVALLNQGRPPLELRIIFKEDSNGAFALLRQSFRAKFAYERLEAGIVKALAEGVVELDAEAAIHRIKLLL